MTPWICSRCGEDQVAFGRIPEDVLCHSCHDAQRAATALTEGGAAIPKLFRASGTRRSSRPLFACHACRAAGAGNPDHHAALRARLSGETLLTCDT